MPPRAPRRAHANHFFIFSEYFCGLVPGLSFNLEGETGNWAF